MTTVIKGLSKTIATMRPGMQSGWSGYVKNGMEKYCAGEENTITCARKWNFDMGNLYQY